MTKILKVFLACSSELEEDRKQFEIFINRLNKELIEKNVFIKLIIWEDFIDAMSQTRLQDEYNKAIKECDIFVMLFFTKVGMYTQEEFDSAFGSFKRTGKPIIYVYFKDAPVKSGQIGDEIISMLAFKKKIAELGHFCTRYDSIAALLLSFGGQLNKLFSENIIDIRIIDGKIIQSSLIFSESDIIPTHISAAHWFDGNSTENAKFSDSKANLYWLDKLLDGGLKLHAKLKDNRRNPLTLLIKGTPGSGKTTLALEMCYRISLQGKSSIYITSENCPEIIKEKASSYGWASAEQCFRISTEPPEEGCAHILVYSEAARAAEQPLENNNWLGRLWSIIGHLLNKADQKDSVAINDRYFEKIKSNIVVLDSLIPDKDKIAGLNRLIQPELDAPDIIILVVDSSASFNVIREWEHKCDIVINLDYIEEPPSNYLFRTIEITKARYQSHVWGKHQLKIYSSPNNIKNIEKNHPYLNEGGIFIYPSIHYFLSRYKSQDSNPETEKMPTPIMTLNELLDKGIPRGRCTAIIGSRGAHKSHLGYYHLLNAIEGLGPELPNENEYGLVISLRDDEGLAKEAMVEILIKMQSKINHNLSDEDKHKLASKRYDELIKLGKLTILYFRPGYIRPEEFYHRVLMSVLKYKNIEDSKLTVLFNSLDQLNARFPLCAHEEIFVPGLIATFSSENVTSIFIGVEEEGQPEGQFGLLTMADLILKARQESISFDKYMRCFERAKLIKKMSDSGIKKLAEKLDILSVDSGGTSQIMLKIISLHVDRFSGGERAGRGGILELVDKCLLQDKFVDGASPLVFAPFS